MQHEPSVADPFSTFTHVRHLQAFCIYENRAIELGTEICVPTLADIVKHIFIQYIHMHIHTFISPLKVLRKANHLRRNQPRQDLFIQTSLISRWVLRKVGFFPYTRRLFLPPMCFFTGSRPTLSLFCRLCNITTPRIAAIITYESGRYNRPPFLPNICQTREKNCSYISEWS